MIPNQSLWPKVCSTSLPAFLNRGAVEVGSALAALEHMALGGYSQAHSMAAVKLSCPHPIR